MTTCKEIMTTEPECCEPTIQVHLIAQTMRTKNIGSVVIVDNMDTMKPVGMVTDRDIAIRVVAEKMDPAVVTAEQIMTQNPISCLMTEPIDEVIQKMESRQVRRISVVDENGKLVGVISQGDLATRLDDHETLAEVVEVISRPGAKRVA